MHGLRTPQLDSPPLPRYGFPELVAGAAPGAGNDFTQDVPGGNFVRLVSVVATLTTDATVADRELVLAYLDAEGNRYGLAGAATTTPAGTVAPYYFQAFTPQEAFPVDGSILVPLPAIILRPTDSFTLHVVNVQSGDTITGVRYEWERFFTDSPPPGL